MKPLPGIMPPACGIIELKPVGVMPCRRWWEGGNSSPVAAKDWDLEIRISDLVLKISSVLALGGVHCHEGELG